MVGCTRSYLIVESAYIDHVKHVECAFKLWTIEIEVVVANVQNHHQSKTNNCVVLNVVEGSITH